MCVIVTAEKGSMPTIDQLTRMSETNPDGAGIAWHDGNGLHRVRHSDNGKTLAFITEHWNELKATPCLIHFRLATHGAVNTENTHPFRYTLGNDEHGYIAHNGIAQKHTNGRYASDSRNAILAWQTGQTDLTDGTQGKFAKIDQNGRIQWLTPPQTIEGAEGEPIQVSNTRWQDTIWNEWRTEYDDAYIEGWNDGYEAAINDMLNDGIDTTTGIRRRKKTSPHDDRGAEERDTHPPPPTAGTEKHERPTAGEPPAPPPPHVRHARTPAGLRPPQAGTEDGEGRNVRRSPACNRRRDTARRTFRPSPSEEQAND